MACGARLVGSSAVTAAGREDPALPALTLFLALALVPAMLATASALDLGASGWDMHYGWGLVQAHAALDALGLVNRTAPRRHASASMASSRRRRRHGPGVVVLALARAVVGLWAP